MNSKVSCVLGRHNTCSSLSQWCGHSASTQTCLCGPARLLPSPCRNSADTHQALRTKLLLSSAPAWQTGEARAAPTPLLIQAVLAAISNQPYEGHSGSPVLFVSLIPPLQSVPNVTEESHLLDGPQTSKEPRSLKVDGQHAGSILNSSSLCQHHAEPSNLCSLSTTTLRIIRFPFFHLAREDGRGQKLAASHQKNPTVHEGSTEQIL